jgi:tetratricopeptide (TPR) repeat protein
MLHALVSTKTVNLQWRGNENYRNIEMATEAVRSARSLGSGGTVILLSALLCKSRAERDHGLLGNALATAREAIEVALARGKSRNRATLHRHVAGLLLKMQASASEIHAELDQAEALYREVGLHEDHWLTGLTRRRGRAFLYQGDIAKARELFEKCLEREHRLHGSPWGVAMSLYWCGRCALNAGDRNEAVALLSVAKKIWIGIESVFVADAQEHIEEIEVHGGRMDEQAVAAQVAALEREYADWL